MMGNNLIDVRITNAQAIDHLTAGLSLIDKDRAIKSGLNEGGKVLKRGGIRRLKARMKSGRSGVKGNLLKSFAVRVKRNVPGVLAGFRTGKDGGSHSHLVDLGTVERMRKSNNRRLKWKGGRTGAAQGNYFWSETKEADMRKAQEKIQTGISNFVEKIKAKSR